MKTYQLVLCSVLVLLYNRQGVGQNTDFPVDLDGDGVSTYGDRAVFGDWLAMGGRLDYALENAQVTGNVIDLSDFFSGRKAALSPNAAIIHVSKSSSSPSAGGGGSGPLSPGACPQPADTPFFTRRLPPSQNPNGQTQEVRTSKDGQFIVFSSDADLGFGPPPSGFKQIYLFERSTVGNGILTHISKDTRGNMATG